MVSFRDIITVVILLAAIALAIYTLTYLGTLNTAFKDNPALLGSTLSASGANVLFWMYIAFLVVLVLYLGYTIFKMVTSVTPQAMLLSQIRTQKKTA